MNTLLMNVANGAIGILKTFRLLSAVLNVKH
nr:MAG TPA: hypothetical protein [Caudoviricetes sp.]